MRKIKFSHEYERVLLAKEDRKGGKVESRDEAICVSRVKKTIY